jgi:hypothetical protein
VPVAVNLLSLSRNIPRQLNEILTEVADGNCTFKVHVSEASKAERSRNRRARLSTVAILSVSVSLLLLSPNLPPSRGLLAWPLSGLLVFLYLLASSCGDVR